MLFFSTCNVFQNLRLVFRFFNSRFRDALVVVAEIKALQSNLTLEQIKEKDTKLRKEVSYLGLFEMALGQKMCLVKNLWMKLWSFEFCIRLRNWKTNWRNCVEELPWSSLKTAR